MSDRPATISPSQISRLMAKSGLGAGAETYGDELIMRMMGVDFSDEYEGYWMKRGTELEPHAIIEYEKQTFTEVTGKKRYWHPEYDFVSGEPDGLIGKDGGIEVKCPKKKYHLANLRNGEQLEKYFDQMQGYMWILNLEWMDFVSYDPRFPKKYQLYKKRVNRHQGYIDKIESRCVKFWNEIVIPKMDEFDLEYKKQLVA